MPELPEVETMVRQIRPHVAGRTVRRFRAVPGPCRPMTMSPGFPSLGKRVDGRTVTHVHRLGKRVVLDLSDATHLVIEPRMTGLMLLADPPDVGHLRLQWDFVEPGTYPTLWFWDQRGLGTVTHFPAGKLDEWLATGRLGPDALSLTADDYRAILQRTARPIKVALLDQKLIAGIGNLYASEILHQARIAPTKPANKLTPRQSTAVHAAAQAILEEAIRYEGSTLGDGTYRNALNKAGGYQNAHRVYDRAGERCPTCTRGTILRLVQAQRSTFYCPQCQRG